MIIDEWSKINSIILTQIKIYINFIKIDMIYNKINFTVGLLIINYWSKYI